MQKTIDFLTMLRENNNREWFLTNKPLYSEAQAEFNAFVTLLIEGIASFDDTVVGLEARDCIYRIYRDTRFSSDKTPYKTHMGAFIAPGGRNSGNAGYYFHVEPSADGMIGGNILSGGVYMPDPAALKSIREDMVYDSEGFLSALARAEGFVLEQQGRLKRIPAGYPTDSPMAEYLKMKNDVSVYKYVDNKFLTSPRLLERVVAEFEKAYEFVRWLNRAVGFAREQQ